MASIIRNAALLALRSFYVSRARVQNMLAHRRSPFGAAKFEQRSPSHANAIEIFAGRWATDLSQLDPTWQGGGAMLAADNRPLLAAQYLGKENRLDGMSVQSLDHSRRCIRIDSNSSGQRAFWRSSRMSKRI